MHGTPKPAERPLRVGELMRREFITATPEDSLTEARQTMRLARLRHLLVVRDGCLVGLLTYRNLLEETLSHGDGPGQRWEVPVGLAMVRDPEWVSTERTLSEAAARLWQTGLGCLPVVEPSDQGPRVVGLVTESDLLRAAYDPLYRNA